MIDSQEIKLFEASWDGDVEELMCILETGVSVDITRPVCHQNTSHCMLLRAHMYHAYCEQDGWHPLMYASQNGHVEVVDKLLQHGARIDLQSKVCFTFQNSLFLTHML